MYGVVVFHLGFDGMPVQQLLGGNAVFLSIALFIILCIFLGVRIVPQSEKHVVERFGRLRSVLGPGINFVVPFLDRVAHKISILERQLPTASQDAITADNAGAMLWLRVERQTFRRLPDTGVLVFGIKTVVDPLSSLAGRPDLAGALRDSIAGMPADTRRYKSMAPFAESLSLWLERTASGTG